MCCRFLQKSLSGVGTHERGAAPDGVYATIQIVRPAMLHQGRRTHPRLHVIAGRPHEQQEGQLA